jgi:hypothetical protein
VDHQVLHFAKKSSQSSTSNGENVANRTGLGIRVGDRSRGRFATPADFPQHDGTPYRGLHVRRERLGFVPRSRAIFCRSAPNPNSYDSQLCHRQMDVTW